MKNFIELQKKTKTIQKFSFNLFSFLIEIGGQNQSNVHKMAAK
jgi:hypothetical protein